MLRLKTRRSNPTFPVRRQIQGSPDARLLLLQKFLVELHTSLHLLPGLQTQDIFLRAGYTGDQVRARQTPAFGFVQVNFIACFVFALLCIDSQSPRKEQTIVCLSRSAVWDTTHR